MIGRNDIGQHMREFAEKEGLLKTPRKSLIGSMFGSRILLATPLLQWYMANDLIVDHVYEVIEYRKNDCFRAFGEHVSDARRAGDSDSSNAIIADTMKLLGNSAYGKTITNQLKHLNVKICGGRDAPSLVNDKYFRVLHDIGDGVYEADMMKKSTSLNLPLQIGFFVYQYAKLRMLEFYYDFLMRFIHPSTFELCEMDTDSAYLAISQNNLEEVIREDKRVEFQKEKNMWFPRNNTLENAAYDKRTPGLFKVEWKGEGIISLCSKTYYCFGDQHKISCKGLNKYTNDITKEKYMTVLTSQNPSSGVNRGFRMKGGDMFTYQQEKIAFSYLYPKRKVSNDGRSTTYLDL